MTIYLSCTLQRRHFRVSQFMLAEQERNKDTIVRVHVLFYPFQQLQWFASHELVS